MKNLFLLLACLTSCAAEYHTSVKPTADPTISIVDQVWVMDAAEAARRMQADPKLRCVKCADPSNPQDKNGINYPGPSYELHADLDGGKGAYVARKQFSTWPLDPLKAAYVPDVPVPADASASKAYFYVLPDKAKGETQGTWTTDDTKASPPDVTPAAQPDQAAPVKTCGTKRKGFIFACSIDAPWTSKYCTGVTAVGGGSTPATTGGNTYTEFTTSGTATITGTGTIEVVVFGGGGGGGDGGGGGAGAGRLLYHATYAVANGDTITVTIGAGGAHHAAGSNSVFGTLTALGGAAGANVNGNGTSGGSGSGAGSDGGGGKTHGNADATSDGAATGFGANGGDSPSGVGYYPAGGGGGAGGVGGNGSLVSTNAGDGGPGTIQWDGAGAAATFGGGGGGAQYTTGAGAGTAGAGGSGGGGAGNTDAGNGSAATVNTGSGGGGGGNGRNGGAGGAGRAVIRFASGGATRQPRPPGGLNHLSYDDDAYVWDERRSGPCGLKAELRTVEAA